MRKPDYEFIDDPANIATFIESIHACSRVAVDLEADSMHNYEEKACLIQLRGSDACGLLDPLAGRDGLAPFSRLLGDEGVEKIFHGGDYDLRLLKRGFGFKVRNLFDTSVAAQLVGKERIGLAALVEEQFGDVIEKKYQRADWSQRPLTNDMMAYAALDVAYLHELREILAAELSKLGRTHWAAEEFDRMTKVQVGERNGPDCLRVKGAGRLTPQGLGVLQQLLETRDKWAKKWDRPPFKVLSNQLLLTLAGETPSNRTALLDRPEGRKGPLPKLADDMLRAIKRGLAIPEAELPSFPKRERELLTEEQEKLFKRLKGVRQKVASELGLEVGLLVNTATLQNIARLETGEDKEARIQEMLKGWQWEAVGPGLVETTLA